EVKGAKDGHNAMRAVMSDASNCVERDVSLGAALFICLDGNIYFFLHCSHFRLRLAKRRAMPARSSKESSDQFFAAFFARAIADSMDASVAGAPFQTTSPSTG